MISQAIGFRVEGVSAKTNQSQPLSRVQNSNSIKLYGRDDLPQDYLEGVFDISDADNDFLYYRDEILSKNNGAESFEFLCMDSSRGPVSISLKRAGQCYTLLIRLVQGNLRRSIEQKQVHQPWWKRLFRFGVSPYDVISSVDRTLPVSRLKKIEDPRLPQALLTYEEQQRIKGFKFGILYADDGQTKEDQMFSNVGSSPSFEKFLDFIGQRVELEQLRGFRAGLDIKGGSTGTHTIFRRYNNNDILFHVSTMLPFNPKDKQQLERKRHIGNDIVIIIFQEGETVYKPTTISSRQVQVVFLVKPVHIEDRPNDTFYRVGVVSRDGVAEFSPRLESDVIFRQDELFLEWMYSKLLNAERACYNAPILNNKLVRTRTSQLKDIATNFT